VGRTFEFIWRAGSFRSLPLVTPRCWGKLVDPRTTGARRCSFRLSFATRFATVQSIYSSRFSFSRARTSACEPRAIVQRLRSFGLSTSRNVPLATLGHEPVISGTRGRRGDGRIRIQSGSRFPPLGRSPSAPFTVENCLSMT